MNRDQMAFEYLLVVTRERAVTFAECFDVADKFLAYAAKEREKEAQKVRDGLPRWDNFTPATTSQEPVKKSAECEHVWCERMRDFCVICGAPKVKEQRKAREWWIFRNPEGNPYYWSVLSEKPKGGPLEIRPELYTHVREILPEDEA